MGRRFKQFIGLFGRQPPPELPPLRDPLDIKVEEIIADIRKRKDSSFRDMVPPDYRRTVSELAASAHSEKAGGRPLVDFIEDMALNWLAKREFFVEVGAAAGFNPVEKLECDADTNIMALTRSASIIFASRPGLDDIRSVDYQRIGIREDVNIPKTTFAVVEGELAVGSRFTTYAHNTSPLIALLECKNPGVEAEKTMAEVATGFKAVDGQTLF